MSFLSIKSKSIYFTGILSLLSCHHTIEKKLMASNVKLAVKLHKPEVKKVRDTLVIPEDTVPDIIVPDNTVQVGEDKVDTTSKIKLLSDGSSYTAQDDVNSKDAKLHWKGIFYNKGNYYIKPTKIRLTKEHSELDDDDKSDQKTGWRVKCTEKDSCLQLISGVDNLIAGPIKQVKPIDFYYAGQKQEFDYQGIKYTLYTTGSKRGAYIYNFKIYLMANVKGHYINQLIRSLGNEVALHHGGDEVDTIFIDFIGDIDGDKIPDIIISDGGYAFGSTSIYLSTPAGNNAIVRLVGYFSQSD